MRKKRLLAILATGERSRDEFASELGISSQPWLSKAYLSPLMLMAQGYIAQTLPKKLKSPLQRYRLLRKGSKTYTKGSVPFIKGIPQEEDLRYES